MRWNKASPTGVSVLPEIFINASARGGVVKDV
jgi:hypothetical protein